MANYNSSHTGEQIDNLFNIIDNLNCIPRGANPSGLNIDNIDTTPGTYWVNSTISEGTFPTGQTQGILIHAYANGAQYVQVFISSGTGGGIWTRVYANNAWYSWKGSSDYIIEEGTSGIWKYRKWYNGTYECWGTYTETISNYGTALGGYSYVTSNISIPSGFYELPKMFYSGKIGSGFCLTGTGNYVTRSAVKCYAVATASGSQATTWDIHLIGRWKA